MADKLYTTQIHHSFNGDTFFPEISGTEWNETERVHNQPDDKNEWAYTFINYSKKK
jgi:dihydrofolate reductase